LIICKPRVSAATGDGASSVTEPAINATTGVFADNVTDWIKGVLTTAQEKALESYEDTKVTSDITDYFFVWIIYVLSIAQRGIALYENTLDTQTAIAILSWIQDETNLNLEKIHPTPATTDNNCSGTEPTINATTVVFADNVTDWLNTFLMTGQEKIL
jgi:hypothetical protein